MEEVRSLKAQTDDLLRTIGGLSVVKALPRVDLVDRLRLVVFPLILGETGREPIFAGLPDIGLELVGTDVLGGHLVALEYRPAKADGRRAGLRRQGARAALSPTFVTARNYRRYTDGRRERRDGPTHRK